MGDKYPIVRVAAVNAASVFLDREASTEKACELIRQAGKNGGGAKLIAFPEGFLPAFPVWFHFHGATSDIGLELSTQLYENSVEVPGPEVDQLCRAAKEAEAYVVMGICEKRPGFMGTMYNTSITISPEGKLINKHQKLVPTVGERIVHGYGGREFNGTAKTEFGPISSLLCSENSNPLAIFSNICEGTRIHVAHWPNFWTHKTKPMKDFVKIATQNIAQCSKCYVLSPCGSVTEDMIKKMQLPKEWEEYLRQPDFAGGTMIAAPNSDIIAGPCGCEDEILYADCDLRMCALRKIEHDYSGVYNRPDIFQLKVNRNPQALYSVDGDPQEPYIPEFLNEEEA